MRSNRLELFAWTSGLSYLLFRGGDGLLGALGATYATFTCFGRGQSRDDEASGPYLCALLFSVLSAVCWISGLLGLINRLVN